MDVDFSGKNVTLTDALRAKAQKKIAKLERFTGPMVSAHVSLQVERRVHHAELMIHCAHDRIYKASGMAEDMYMAINEAADAIEQQAKKEKGRRLSGRNRGVATSESSEGEAEEEEEPPKQQKEERYARRGDLFLPKPMSVADAMLAIRELRAPVVVFRDAKSGRLQVLFKDEGGAFSLIEAPGKP
jgi:putative sigma-54 modulation protein